MAFNSHKFRIKYIFLTTNLLLTFDLKFLQYLLNYDMSMFEKQRIRSFNQSFSLHRFPVSVDCSCETKKAEQPVRVSPLD